MTNKILFSLAAATMLMATSCSEDNLGGSFKPEGSEATVNLSVELPGTIQGRNYSDGTTAKELKYALYELNEADQSISALIGTFTEEINLKKNIPLKLVTGKTYGIVFWAQAPKNEIFGINFSETGAKMQVDWFATWNNDETFDAFYTYKVINVTGDTQVSAQLKRPFAQINIGTNDLEDAAKLGFKAQTSELWVWFGHLPYDMLDLMTGEVSVSSYTQEHNNQYLLYKSTPFSTTEDFPVKGKDLKYLSMSYVLVGENQELVDLDELVVYPEGSGEPRLVKITNVPVRRNYRTNIYGQVLTSNVDLVVEIVPDFETPDYEMEIWDGNTLNQPVQDTDGTYLIGKASEWVYLAKSGQRYFDSKIKLTAEINFGGFDVPNFYFNGEFDGQDHMMTNFTIVPVDGYSTGLFRGDVGASNLTVKNITFKDVKIDNYNKSGSGYAGIILGDIQNNKTVNIENVKVYNADIKGVLSVGTLVGFVATQTTLNLKDCTVEDSHVSNYAVANESGYIAGLVGRPVGTVTAENCSISHSTVDGYWATRRTEASISAAVGGSEEFTGVTVNNVTVNKTEISGDVATTPEEVLAAVKGGKDVLLADDIEIEAAVGNGYGNSKGGVTVRGTVFDGGGNTLYVTGTGSGDWTSLINTTGGTIKNVTVKGDGMFKGILGWSMTENLYLEKVIVPADFGGAYGFNIDAANNHYIQIKDCVFHGWCSWGQAATPQMDIINTYFGIGTYYGGNSLFDGLVKPYPTTVFDGCEFHENIYMDLSALLPDATITFRNCTVNGEKLTLENHKIMKGYLLGGETDWENFENVKDRIFFE